MGETFSIDSVRMTASGREIFLFPPLIQAKNNKRRLDADAGMIGHEREEAAITNPLLPLTLCLSSFLDLPHAH